MAIETAALIEKFQYALDNRWGYIWGTAGVLWTEARQKAIEKTTDDDRKSAREYGAKWIGHTVTDCSGLFNWAFRELGGYMYHGSNTMWDKYCTAKGELKNGKRTDGQELKPGTAVFCYNGVKRSHVGLYIGDGTVIEASGTINGVIKTKITNTKWKEWGELKGVDYTASGAAGGSATKPSGDTATYPTLRKGNRGQDVVALQEALVAHGYSVGSYGIDGDFGSGTQKAVTAFQRDHGLVVDGIVGPATWAALKTEAKPVKKYQVVISGLTEEQAEKLRAEYPGASVTAEG